MRCTNKWRESPCFRVSLIQNRFVFTRHVSSLFPCWDRRPAPPAFRVFALTKFRHALPLVFQQVDVDLKEANEDQFDDSNVLVLPSKKRATKVTHDQGAVVKKLSKKQRKRLEKILEVKEKKKKVRKPQSCSH